VAKRVDRFTKPFRDSRIPFLLGEIITDGQGEMVDIICRFANAAGAAALGLPLEDLQKRRFTHVFPAERLKALAPLRDVAFSGSAASFSYTTALNRTLSVICYQPIYGLAACILDPVREEGSPEHTRFLAENLPAAVVSIELSRAGVRCLSFSPRLCMFTGRDRRELLDRFSQDFSALVEPADWPELLQSLLDAARDGHHVIHAFRLRRREQPPLWVELRAELLHRREGVSSFYAILLDSHQSHQTRSQLESAREHLEKAQEELRLLFEESSAALCVFRRETPESPALPLRLSQGLCRLLGYSLTELTHRLAANPMWRIPTAEREALTAAAAAASGGPLRHVCRLRTREGQLLWAALEVTWHPLTDGSCLIVAACFDISRERETAEEIRFRAELCELMLDRNRMMSFDYDPIEDVARSERHDGSSHRVLRITENYLSYMDNESAIHPEDRERRAAMMKRLLSRPGKETLEYRADYDGQGWRWCRISWISLMDRSGSVCRLLGKAEDITQRKIGALRFQSLAARQRKLPAGVLAHIRLDLSADRITDAKAGSRYLSGVLFGNTADACLRHLRDNVPDAAQRQEFDALLRRQPLLDALRGGTLQVSLEHRFSIGKAGEAVWAHTAAELAEDPDTLHLTAFCTITNVDGLRQRNEALNTLALRDYDFILTVNATTGLCRVYGKDAPAGPVPYRTVAAQYLGLQAPSRKRSAFRQAARLKTVLERLKTEDLYEYTGSLGTDTPLEKRMRWSWMDRAAALLLVTLSDA